MSKRLTTAARKVLCECGFDRKKHRTADPKANSDRVSVSAALLVALHDAAADVPKATKGLPWSVEELKRRKDKEGFVRAVLPLDIAELGVGVYCLNDVSSRAITGDESALEDISYRPVGVDGDSVLVEVTGNVDGWLQRHEDEPAEEEVP